LGKEEIVFPHKENKTGRSDSFPMLHVITCVNYYFFSHTRNSYTGKTALFPTWEKHLLILPFVPLRQSWLALFPLNVSPLDRLPWGFCFFLAGTSTTPNRIKKFTLNPKIAFTDSWTFRKLFEPIFGRTVTPSPGWDLHHSKSHQDVHSIRKVFELILRPSENCFIQFLVAQ